jgi:hypothetical protein
MLRQWRWNDLALLDQKGFRTDVKEILAEVFHAKPADGRGLRRSA